MIKSRNLWIIGTGLVIASALVVAVQMSDMLERLNPEETITEETTPETVPVPESILPTAFTFIDEYIQNDQKKIRLSGTGEPNTVIVVLDGGQRARQIRSDDQGGWSVILDADDDRPMVLEAVSFNDQGITVRGDETVYRIVIPRELLSEDVLARRDQIAQAQGLSTPRPTLIMVTAPGGPTRIVKSPFGGMPTNGPLTMGPIDFDETGGVIFSGVTSEEGRVRLYVNDAAIGETRVGVGGRWNFIAGRRLPQGELDIRAELIRSDGERVQVSVPFVFKSNAHEVKGLQPLVIFEPLRWQIKRELLGGGVQSTAIFAPEGTEPLMDEE